MNRILIIDDDKELCMLIKQSVLVENMQADFCHSGMEGLTKPFDMDELIARIVSLIRRYTRFIQERWKRS